MARMVSTASNPRADAVRRALVDATTALLFERGTDVTLDEIAERAKVGRRTIFRYFPSKDDIVARAIAEFFAAVVAAIPARDGRDVTAWLRDVATTMHEQNLRMAPAYLELVPRRREITGVTTFLDRPGRPRRQQLMHELAHEAWSASGGPATVPATIVNAFTLHLSVYGTEALRFHCRLDVNQMAELTVQALTALIRANVAERPPTRSKRR